MRAMIVEDWCEPKDMKLVELARSRARRGPGGDRRQGGRLQLLRHPDRAGEVSGAAAAAVLARWRGGGDHPRRRAGRQRLAGRRPRLRHARLGRLRERRAGAGRRPVVRMPDVDVVRARRGVRRRVPDVVLRSRLPRPRCSPARRCWCTPRPAASAWPRCRSAPRSARACSPPPARPPSSRSPAGTAPSWRSTTRPRRGSSGEGRRPAGAARTSSTIRSAARSSISPPSASPSAAGCW